METATTTSADILRLTNLEVIQTFEGVCAKIQDALEVNANSEAGKLSRPSLKPPARFARDPLIRGSKKPRYPRRIESKNSALDLVARSLSIRNSAASSSSIGKSSLRSTQTFCSTGCSISSSSRRVPERFTLIAG